ncbi:hypothetical protein Tco_1086859, partial [Tanacetum coccineum]
SKVLMPQQQQQPYPIPQERGNEKRLPISNELLEGKKGQHAKEKAKNRGKQSYTYASTSSTLILVLHEFLSEVMSSDNSSSFRSVFSLSYVLPPELWSTPSSHAIDDNSLHPSNRRC